MANIQILDDCSVASALLKLTLTRHRHRVSRTADINRSLSDPCGFVPDLVLINHSFRNHSGWEIFNRLKRSTPHIRAMVYALEQLSTTNVSWIVKAVEAAVWEPIAHPFLDEHEPKYP